MYISSQVHKILVREFVIKGAQLPKIKKMILYMSLP